MKIIKKTKKTITKKIKMNESDIRLLEKIVSSVNTSMAKKMKLTKDEELEAADMGFHLYQLVRWLDK